MMGQNGAVEKTSVLVRGCFDFDFCGTGSRRETYSSRGGADSVAHLLECGWQKPETSRT
jgi:hypothetical protein